jgi:hypothetical protein
VSVVKVEGDGVVAAKVARPSSFCVSTFNATGKPIDISKSDLDIIFGDQLGDEMYGHVVYLYIDNSDILIVSIAFRAFSSHFSVSTLRPR